MLWSLDRRELGFFDWRPRLALGGRGEAWIGGTAPPGENGGWLYRRHQGRWVRWERSPAQRARTFVLDVDPTGALWLCDYSPTGGTTYGGLRVRRYDGRRWHEEIVRPGIWPQAMAMVSPEEGWIGGNHGELLHLREGRWRSEILPLRRRHGTNILALRMTGRGDGWLAGTRGLVASYREERWRVVPVPETMRREEIYALDVDPEGRLWVVGDHGLIARYDGRIWARLASPVSFKLMDVAMVSAADGWAVGEHGTILRWDGREWRRQPSPTLSDLHAVAMASAGEGWIVANDLVLRASPPLRPWFREVSEQPRYAAALQPGRKLAAVDADGDGDLDLFSFQTAALRLYANRGAEGFFAVPGLEAPPLSTFEGFSWGDLEGDGDPDLLVQGRAPGAVWLYRNQGDLRFAGPERLLPGSPGASHSSALVDFDGDGLPELFLGRGSGRFGFRVHRNDGAGRFRRAPAEVEDGTGEGAGLLTFWGDLDGDLDLDGVLPGDGREIRLLLNQAGRLRDATRAAGLAGALPRGRIQQGGLLDLDRDGDLDLLLLGDRLSAFLNDGKARFRRDDRLFEPVANNPAIPSALSAFGDLDGDGFPEVLLQPVTGRREVRLFSRSRDGRYRDVTARAGLAGLTGDAAVFADWDGDGDPDLYLADDERGRLLEN
ncbi:MAG TPA: FG-GAP-like repeat-containing protein, partial [Thermoanaerobaculia bacterium]|nr:FG-GAP-like repeat-containing protein [Thermoanaerobaculia bacterium]